LEEYGAPDLSVAVAEKPTEYHITVSTTDAYQPWAEKLLLTLGYGPVKLIDQKSQTWAQAYLKKRPVGAAWHQPGCGKKPQGAWASEVEGGPPPSWASQGKLYGQGYRPPSQPAKRRGRKGGIGKALKEWFA